MDTVLNGRYRLVAMLGRGGMGEVWRAVDLTLGRPVAVKVIRSGDVSTPSVQDELLERFKREARAIAALSHPNIVTAHDFGVDESTTTQFLVMELIDGVSMASEMAARLEAGEGGMAVADVCAIGIDVCSGLAAAHRDGVVHRDLKPENLMRDRRTGQLKIVDFGIARSTEMSRITVDGIWLGSLPYIAPEQLAGESDPRSDLYSLGCLLFELLTGRSAFDARDQGQFIVAHYQSTPHKLREFVPSAPAELETLLAEMLAKEPADRPDAESAARRLREIVRAPKPVKVPEPPVPDYLGAPMPPRRRRWVGPVVVTAALLIAGGAAWWTGTRPAHGSSGAPGPGKVAAAPCGLRLAFLGAFNGDPLHIAANAERGAALAVHEYNADHGADCVRLVDFDTKADTATTQSEAASITNDPTTVGVIGGVSSREVLDSAPTFERSGLPFISPTATDPTLSHQGWTTFHRAVSTDEDIPLAIARYAVRVLNANRVYLVNDASAAGQGLTVAADTQLVDRVVGRISLGSNPVDGTYGYVAATVKNAQADAVVLGGSATAAAKLRHALTSLGWSGPLIGGSAIMTDQLTKTAPGAGTIAVSWFPPVPTTGAFYNNYKALSGTPPQPYADLGYDAAMVFLRGLETGHGTRAGMLAWLAGYHDVGVVQSYRFTATGELDPASEWVYRVDGTAFVPVGPAPVP